MRTLIETWIILIILFIIGAILCGVYSCSSYLTSGEVGKDIGEFAADIKEGYEEK